MLHQVTQQGSNIQLILGILVMWSMWPRICTNKKQQNSNLEILKLVDGQVALMVIWGFSWIVLFLDHFCRVLCGGWLRGRFINDDDVFLHKVKTPINNTVDRCTIEVLPYPTPLPHTEMGMLPLGGNLAYTKWLYTYVATISTTSIDLNVTKVPSNITYFWWTSSLHQLRWRFRP